MSAIRDDIAAAAVNIALDARAVREVQSQLAALRTSHDSQANPYAVALHRAPGCAGTSSSAPARSRKRGHPSSSVPELEPVLQELDITLERFALVHVVPSPEDNDTVQCGLRVKETLPQLTDQMKQKWFRKDAKAKLCSDVRMQHALAHSRRWLDAGDTVVLY